MIDSFDARRKFLVKGSFLIITGTVLYGIVHSQLQDVRKWENRGLLATFQDPNVLSIADEPPLHSQMYWNGWPRFYLATQVVDDEPFSSPPDFSRYRRWFYEDLIINVFFWLVLLGSPIYIYIRARSNHGLLQFSLLNILTTVVTLSCYFKYLSNSVNGSISRLNVFDKTAIGLGILIAIIAISDVISLVVKGYVQSLSNCPDQE